MADQQHASSPAIKAASPASWKRSARRVQLAVKRGRTRVAWQSPPRTSNTTNTNSNNNTLDEALHSLYSISGASETASSEPSILCSPPSYVPQPPAYDWVLDGLPVSAHALRNQETNAQQLLQNLRQSSDWNYLEAKIRQAEQSLYENTNNEDDEFDDDDEFGDFQSASAAVHPEGFDNDNSTEPSKDKASVSSRNEVVDDHEDDDNTPQKSEAEFQNKTNNDGIIIEEYEAPLAGGEAAAPAAAIAETTTLPNHSTTPRTNQKICDPAASWTTHGSMDDTNTVVLVSRADELLHGASPTRRQSSSNLPTSPLSMDTPQLVRRTDCVLELFRNTDHDETDGKDEDGDGDSTSLDANAARNNLEAVAATSPQTPSPPVGHRHHHHHTNSIEPTTRLPSFLTRPLTADVNSPEARYIRRKQIELGSPTGDENDDGIIRRTNMNSRFEEPTTDLESLPDYYWEDPSLHEDDTGQVLAGLPWYYVNEISELDLWDEHMAAELSRLDAARQCVQRRLLCRIQPKQADLERASALIHASERHLRLANLYHERTARAVAEGSSSIAGMRALVKDWEAKEACQQLMRTLQQVESILETEAKIVRAIDDLDPSREADFAKDYSEIMSMSNALLERVTTEPLVRLDSLGDTRQRLNDVHELIWSRLCTLLDKILVDCCRSDVDGDLKAYDCLLRAARNLHDSQQQDGDYFVTRWTDRILQALEFEADWSLVDALIDPEIMAHDRDADSEFDQELAVLSIQVESAWGDAAKLRTITHNLVTIRFDFESDRWNLVAVLQKLCRRLTLSLATLSQVQSLHNDGDDQGEGMMQKLKESRVRLWEHCEMVLHRCLSEYFRFSEKRQLFSTDKDETTNDAIGTIDLEQLHVVHVLTERFASLREQYVADDTNDSYDRTESPLYQVLGQVFRRHLRIVHIEAMNTMGRYLARENWYLVPVDLPDEPEKTAGDPPALEMRWALTNSLWRSVSKVYASPKCSVTDCSGAERTTAFSAASARIFDIQFDQQRNWSANAKQFDPVYHDTATTDAKREIQCRLDSMLSSDEFRPRWASSSAYLCLVPWVGRVLAVVDFLPRLNEDAATVVSNLIDLYLVTVLRICASCGPDERRLLGLDDPDTIPLPATAPLPKPTTKRNTSASQLFGFRMSEKLSHVENMVTEAISLPSTLTADICSPLLADYKDTRYLSSFITRAQTSLQDVVHVDKVDGWFSDNQSTSDSPDEIACVLSQTLEKRMAAAWSCYFVAAVADACAALLSSFGCDPSESQCKRDGSKVSSYVGTVLTAVPTLVTQASRISCARAVDCKLTVERILQERCMWEESKLHEDPNDYVYELSERCSLLWGYLSASAKLPKAALHNAWKDTIMVSYLGLLEGFARVPWCSTEGRALMTLDLATFNECMTPSSVFERLEERSLPFKPPKVQAPIDMRYVETFVKVFYYPKDEVIAWIERNIFSYRLPHLLALAASTVSDPEQSPELSHAELSDQIKTIVRAEKDKVDETFID